MQQLSFDYLIIGGGIAGLTFALRAAESGSVAVLFKGDPSLSSTSWAQGGIAAVSSFEDSFELHVKDTLTAGAGLCNPEIVKLVVREGAKYIAELENWGVTFDRNQAGRFDLHREGGHTVRRILHQADRTGAEIQLALLKSARSNSNIQFFQNACAVDLITSHKLNRSLHLPNQTLGAYVILESGEIEPILARQVLLATGGAGKIYRFTTNPDVATGDGIAMAFRAGCPVGNLEFFQFHPTCLYHPKVKNFLITEALRGEGAILRRVNGEPFMHRYHELKELAPRDIVARAIDNEMKLHGEEHVLLDITHRQRDFLKAHFPMIYERCLELGIDMATQPIPVVPAAHYSCGGVISDRDGRTCIPNLFVAGEAACTGLHGANRLASNSLLEGLVFGIRAAECAKTALHCSALPDEVPAWDPGNARESDEDVVITQNWGEIRRFMWNYVGIVRTTKRLERALRRSELIRHEIMEYYWNTKVTVPLIELRNLNLVASLVIQSALSRKESRGLHYTLDYPRAVEALCRDTVIEP
jgi:L-aspartate oxidase